MKSLKERLRHGCGDTVRDTALMMEAAAAIERLEAERDQWKRTACELSWDGYDFVWLQ